MWGFGWEPVVAAGITGVLTFLGVALTVWASSRTTRQHGLDQHNEQNEKLDKLLTAHQTLDTKVDRNHQVASQGLSELKGTVAGLSETNNVLFNMIVDIDTKVSKQSNRKTTVKNPVEVSNP